MYPKFASVSVVIFAALTLAGTATAAPKTVNGTVGPGFTIALKLNGANVAKLKAGVPYRSDQRQVVDPRLSHHGARTEQGRDVCRLHRDEVVRRDAQEGHVQVHVRPARVLHARELQGRLTLPRDLVPLGTRSLRGAFGRQRARIRGAALDPRRELSFRPYVLGVHAEPARHLLAAHFEGERTRRATSAPSHAGRRGRAGHPGLRRDRHVPADQKAGRQHLLLGQTGLRRSGRECGPRARRTP